MIELHNVSKIIKGRKVLDDISMTFNDGSVYGLKGINGSGKTMLMRLLSGLIYPSSGSVLIDGRRLGEELSFPPNMGLLIENPVFLNSYTGYKNLELLSCLNGKIGEDEIREALKKVGLDPDDRRKYRKYSLGMKQRLGIAAGIMESPHIMILDEPLNALDKDGVILFDRIMKEEKKKGTLMILTCHDDDKLKEYSDIIVTLENGKVLNIEAV